MANRLKNILRFTNVAGGGGMASQAHLLNVNDVGVVPDLVLRATTGDFDITADDTNVTVTNNGADPADIDVYVHHWHTYEREFGTYGLNPVTDLVPQPFVASGGGAATGVQNAQTFRYTATGAEGSDFSVTLPAARSTDVYSIAFSQADATSLLAFQFPDALAGDRTTTAFRVVTSSALTVGDTIDFLVYDRV